METIIAALIGSGASLIVCIISNHYTSSKTQALLEYRLRQLEEKVDKHNHLVERMYKVESDIGILTTKFDDFEKGVSA